MEQFKNLFDKYGVLKSDNLDLLCTALRKHAESEEIKQIRAIQKEMVEKLKTTFIIYKAPENKEKTNYNTCDISDNLPCQVDLTFAIMPEKPEHTYYHVVKHRNNSNIKKLKPLLFVNQIYVELSIGEEIWGDLSFQELKEIHPYWKEEFPVFCFFKIIEVCGNFVRCKVIESTNDCFPKNGGEFTLHEEDLHSNRVKFVKLKTMFEL